jgi:phosphatidylserine/phosphatidylglycerophosphate/cardiolipin synthase-like enzyme
MIKGGNRLTLLENGADYFPALIAALVSAQREIHLESYIFANDAAADAVAEALMRAAQRGVETRLLLDGFGSRGFAPERVNRLRAAGVNVLFFRPERGFMLLQRRRLRRMHRKLAVIDASIGFVGGINLIDDLNGRNLAAPRQDYAVRVEGPLVADMHIAARQLWQRVMWSRLGLQRGEAAWLKPSTHTDRLATGHLSHPQQRQPAAGDRSGLLARDSARAARNPDRQCLFPARTPLSACVDRRSSTRRAGPFDRAGTFRSPALSVGGARPVSAFP